MRQCLAWLLLPLLASCAGISGPREAMFEDVIGGHWHWVGMLADSGATAVPDPGLYWAEFTAAGGIVLLADCNSGLGRVESGTLAIGPIALTRGMCEPASLDARFVAMLSQVRSGAFDGELLRLRARLGELILVRDARASLQIFACPAAASLTVAFGGDHAYLQEGPRFRPLARQAATSGERYVDGEIVLQRTGNELMLQSRTAKPVGPCMLDPTGTGREAR